MNISRFKLINFSNEKNRTSLSQTLEVKKDDIIIKLTKTVIDDHQKIISDRKFLLNLLFMPTISPYPQEITQVIECPKEFKPKSEIIKDGEVFTLFAGERFNFGICSQDLVKYSAVYGIFDCGEKGVFEIWLYGKNENDLTALAKSFSC